MLENLKIIWSIDWCEVSHKNWAEKERLKYQKANTTEYGLFHRKLQWFQGRDIDELIERKDMEKIGKDPNGHKLNFRIHGNTIRIFGFLDSDHSIFHALLFLIKKTNKVTKNDLKTFGERIKIYEK